MVGGRLTQLVEEAQYSGASDRERGRGWGLKCLSVSSTNTEPYLRKCENYHGSQSR